MTSTGPLLVEVRAGWPAGQPELQRAALAAVSVYGASLLHDLQLPGAITVRATAAESSSLVIAGSRIHVGTRPDDPAFIAALQHALFLHREHFVTEHAAQQLAQVSGGDPSQIARQARALVRRCLKIGGDDWRLADRHTPESVSITVRVTHAGYAALEPGEALSAAWHHRVSRQVGDLGVLVPIPELVASSSIAMEDGVQLVINDVALPVQRCEASDLQRTIPRLMVREIAAVPLAFLTHASIRWRLDLLRTVTPLIDTCLELLSENMLFEILESLVEESVPILHLGRIIGAIVERYYAPDREGTADLDDYVRHVRLAIRREIAYQLAPALNLVLANRGARRRSPREIVELAPLGSDVSIDRQVERARHGLESGATVVIAPGPVRKQLWAALRHEYARVTVLAHEEIPLALDDIAPDISAPGLATPERA